MKDTLSEILSGYHGQHIKGELVISLESLRDGKEQLAALPIPKRRYPTVQKRAHRKAKVMGLKIRTWYSGNRFIIAREYGPQR